MYVFYKSLLFNFRKKHVKLLENFQGRFEVKKVAHRSYKIIFLSELMQEYLPIFIKSVGVLSK